MGSVASVSTGLAYLTQPGGPLSNLPAGVSASVLQSASPEDLVTLSEAALQAQEVDGILGIQPANQSANAGANILQDVSSADLNNATPQQQNEINSQAQALQETQQLLAPSSASESAV